MARANLVEYSLEDSKEQEEYDEAYYALESDEEDFREALPEQAL